MQKIISKREDMLIDMLHYLIYVLNIKIRFIKSYVPNSKFKLHRTSKFCSTYELQYTQFFPGKVCLVVATD